MKKHWSLVLAGAMGLCGLASPPRAMGQGCEVIPNPVIPTPYPDATPPAVADGSVAAAVFGGVTFEVDTGAELLAAVSTASAGDTIVLTGPITQSVTLTTSGLRFMGAAGGRKAWKGTPGPSGESEFPVIGLPALDIAADVEVTLENLEVTGGLGSSGNGQFDLFGTPGGSGGPGALIAGGAKLNLVNCLLAGANGRQGSNREVFCQFGNNTIYTGRGGSGGAAWTGAGNLYADMQSSLRGGAAAGGYPAQPGGFGSCCLYTGQSGFSIAPGSPTQWVEFTTPFGNVAARAVGDFDGSGCTEVGDFLLLLDNWQTVVGGSLVGITDFLAVIDNWQTGPGC